MCITLSALQPKICTMLEAKLCTVHTCMYVQTLYTSQLHLPPLSSPSHNVKSLKITKNTQCWNYQVGCLLPDSFLIK